MKKNNFLKKPTKRQKFLATAIYPTVNGYSTWDEVREAKIACRGHYWNDLDYGEFRAFSPKGRRFLFTYDSSGTCAQKNEPTYKLAKKCAQLAAQGNVRLALKLEKLAWNNEGVKSEAVCIQLLEKYERV